MHIDMRGRVVVVTGGTRGIGLATGLAFGRAGAEVFLTHRWGSADEDEVRASFARAGAAPPQIVEADASRPDDTETLLARISEAYDAVDVFVSNVCVVPRADGIDSYRERDLYRTLEYGTWPMFDHLHAMKRVFGRYPRYALAMSSDGPDSHYPGYDYVAFAKSVLETMCRYLSAELRDDGVRVNVLRTRQVVTEGFGDIFGDTLAQLAARFPAYRVGAEEVAATALALCSGLLDAMSGQVITVDRGAGFVDNMMTLGPGLMAPQEGAADVAP